MEPNANVNQPAGDQQPAVQQQPQQTTNPFEGWSKEEIANYKEFQATRARQAAKPRFRDPDPPSSEESQEFRERTANAPEASAETEVESDARSGQGYDLRLPESLAISDIPENHEELLDSFSEIAGSAGVSGRLQQRLIDAMADAVMDHDYQAPLTGLGAYEDAARYMQREWGQDFDKNMDHVTAGIDKLGGDKLRYWLDETGYGNSPAFLEALRRFGSGELSLSRAEAQQRLDKIMGDKSHAYHKPGSTRERKRVMSEVRLLLAIANEETAPKPRSWEPPKPSAQESAKAGIRAELATLAAKKSLTPDERQKFISLTAKL